MYIDRQLAGSWGTTGGCIAAARGRRARRSKATNRGSRRWALLHRDLRDRPALQDRVRLSVRQLPGDRHPSAARAVEKDEIALPSLSSKFFYDSAAGETPTRGFFADPRYGGNRDKVGAGSCWGSRDCPVANTGIWLRAASCICRTGQRARRPDGQGAARRGRLSQARGLLGATGGTDMSNSKLAASMSLSRVRRRGFDHVDGTGQRRILRRVPGARQVVLM